MARQGDREEVNDEPLHIVLGEKPLKPDIARIERKSSWLLAWASSLLKWLTIKPNIRKKPIGAEEGIRNALFDNLLEFAETSARKIMIPRTEMKCLYTGLSFRENRDIALLGMHTRYPVCDPDKDHTIGFVHMKDLLQLDQDSMNLREVVRPITTVPESMPIGSLLKLMQKQRTQMVLLIDEYGGTSGLVTLEDIMEEIVGEIQDEFDEERAQIEKVDENVYSIDGKMLIEEVNGFFGLEIECDHYDTIGGWVYSQIEIPPEKYKKLIYKDVIEFVVEEIYRMRIVRLQVRNYQVSNHVKKGKNLRYIENTED